MKTNELIDLLVNDLRALPPLGHILVVAAMSGTLVATMAFSSMIGIRADIRTALTSERFLHKILLMLSLVFSAACLIRRSGMPGTAIGARKWLFSAPLMLIVVGVLAELVVTPVKGWGSVAMGRNGFKCLVIVPLLSVVPLGCLLHGLRLAAPEHPGAAGAVAGILAAGISSTLYALNCDDDSPLFVIVWYVPAIAIVVLAGYVLGSRLLRW